MPEEKNPFMDLPDKEDANPFLSLPDKKKKERYIMLGGQRVPVRGKAATVKEDVSSMRDPKKKTPDRPAWAVAKSASPGGQGGSGSDTGSGGVTQARTSPHVKRSQDAAVTSKELRDAVNKRKESTKKATKPFFDVALRLSPVGNVPLVGGVLNDIISGLPADILHLPENVIAEGATVGDSRESLLTRAGALANLVSPLLPVEEKVIGAGTKLVKKVFSNPNTNPFTITEKAVQAAVNSHATRNAARAAKAAAKDGVGPVKAQNVVQEIAQDASPQAPNAPTPTAPAPVPTIRPPAKGATRVNVGGQDYDLTGEAKGAYEAATQAYKAKVERIKAEAAATGADKEWQQSRLHAAAQMHSADLRRIVGGMTPAEAKRAEAQAQKVVAGTPVVLPDGRTGVAKNNAYGKVTVVLDDGSSVRLDRADVKPATVANTGALPGATPVKPTISVKAGARKTEAATAEVAVVDPPAEPVPVVPVVPSAPTIAPPVAPPVAADAPVIPPAAQPVPVGVASPEVPTVAPSVSPPDIDPSDIGGLRMADLAAVAARNDYTLPDRVTLKRKVEEVQAEALRNREAVEQAVKGATLEPNPSLTSEERFIGQLKLKDINEKTQELAARHAATKNEAEREALSLQLDALFNEGEALSQTLWKSNSNKGRELAFLRSTVPDDFDDVAMLVKAERLSGGTLTNKTRLAIITISEKGRKMKGAAEARMRKDADDALARIRRMGLDNVNLRDLGNCK